MRPAGFEESSGRAGWLEKGRSDDPSARESGQADTSGKERAATHVGVSTSGNIVVLVFVGKTAESGRAHSRVEWASGLGFLGHTEWDSDDHHRLKNIRPQGSSGEVYSFVVSYNGNVV